MRRRDFLAAAGALAGWPALAQQPSRRTIGFLGPSTAQLFTGRLQAFRQGVSEVFGGANPYGLTIAGLPVT